MAEKILNKEFFWKSTLGAIIVIFIVATAASVMVAKHKVSRVVDADYYYHGLHYGESGKPALGAARSWHMVASLTDGHLQVQVRDSSGAPVSGGTLSFNTEPGATGAGRSLVLQESSPGNYVTAQPEQADQLRGIMRFVKGEASITGKVVFLN